MKNLTTYLSVLVVLLSCSCSEDEKLGTGPIVTQEINIESLTKVDFQVPGSVKISQGPEQKVTVTSHSNVIDGLNRSIQDNAWNINFGNKSYKYDRLEIDITMPNLERVTLRGVGLITLNEFENQSNMNFEVFGAGSIEIQQLNEISNMTAEISGLGELIVLRESSILDNLDISVDGSGNFIGFMIPTRSCTIDISGNSDVVTTTIDNLDIKIVGSGRVYYKGQPAITTDISGSGILIDAN